MSSGAKSSRSWFAVFNNPQNHGYGVGIEDLNKRAEAVCDRLKAEWSVTQTRVGAWAYCVKHYAGCYLYNYGDCCPITDEEMKFQLDLYLRLWLEKKIDGIIVCSNNIVDTGLNSVEIFRAWQQENGSRTR